MEIKTLSEAQQFIYSHIEVDPAKRFAGEFGLRRGAYLLSLLGNPQNDLKVIHIAGTSGKGSTAFYISQILRSQGFDVSLTVSPHLVDIRERCQINNELVGEIDFVKTLNSIIPAIEKMKSTEFKSPSYFEIIIALFFVLSRERKVDYAVVETGLGGTFDGTNTVNREDKVCVITRIGLDHTEILGKTISAIASQKAGIIWNKNLVLSSPQHKSASAELIKRVSEKNGKLEFVSDSSISIKEIRKEGLIFDFNFDGVPIDSIVLRTSAHFQVLNCALAIGTVIKLAKRDRFPFNMETMKKLLKHVSFPGRMELYRIGEKQLILDGAHNPQKMKTFIGSMRQIGIDKGAFLIAFRAGKDFKAMLRHIVPVAEWIVVTSFKMSTMDLKHSSQDPNEVRAELAKIGYDNVKVVANSSIALRELIAGNYKNLVVTGSLYLLSDLYPQIKKISG